MPAAQATTAQSGDSPWPLAGFLFIGAFVTLLDTTIVNLALPHMGAALSAAPSALQWVLISYVLAFAGGLLPFGRFGDVLGRRRLFLWGMGGFTLVSGLSGLAPTVEVLILLRAAKGVAAAMMLPQILAIIQSRFPPQMRPRAISGFAMVSGLGALAGPLLGGLLLAADPFGLGWRMVFLINVPLGLLCLVGVARRLPPSGAGAGGPVDWGGAALIACAACAALYPLVEGRARGWPLWMLAPWALSLACLLLFRRQQSRRAARGQVPLVPPEVFRSPAVRWGLVAGVALFAGVAGPLVVLAIALQQGLSWPPAAAGLALAVHPLGAMVASLVSGRLGQGHLVARLGVGVAALLCGMIGLRSLFAPEVAPLTLAAPLALIGVGVGAATVALYQLVLRPIDPRDAGAGAGAFQTAQQIGLALGIAATGQLFFAGLPADAGAEDYRSAVRAALWVPLVIYGGMTVGCLVAALPRRRGADA